MQVAERKIGVEFTSDGAIHRLDNGNDIHYQKSNYGTYYHKETSPAVVSCLEAARTDNTTVRIFLGNLETGKVWPEEHDVYGKIGRSMGPLKVPLLVEKGEDGGGALLDHCIMRIVAVKNKKRIELYRHPKYVDQVATVTPIGQDDELFTKGYKFRVALNGEDFASCKTEKKAKELADFMVFA